VRRGCGFKLVTDATVCLANYSTARIFATAENGCESSEISDRTREIVEFDERENIFITAAGNGTRRARLTKMDDWKDFTSDLWDNDTRYTPFEKLHPDQQEFIREQERKLFGDQAKLPGQPGGDTGT
jgi:hypothetical protein